MPVSVFLDANIQKGAVDLRWIKERRHITWGDITQEVEVEAVRPRSPRSSKNEAWLQSELDLVPEIGEAARREEIVCFDNQEVRFELHNLRYGGLVRSRMSALHGVTIRKVPPPLPERAVVIGGGASWEQQKKLWVSWLRSCADPRYAELRSALGTLGTLAENTLVDLYHLYSAEKAGLNIFLTLDKNSLVEPLRSQNQTKPGVSVLYPSELLARLG